MIDTAQLTVQCVHAVKLALEGLLTAGLLTFLWLILPACRNGGPRR